MDLGEKTSLAFKHYQEGNFAQAETDCLEILFEQPDNSEILHLLGLACHLQGAHERAVVYLEKALQLDSENADIHYDLGNVFYELGMLNEALGAYQKAVWIEPENTNALSNLGMVCHDLGQIDQAIMHYQKALALDPNSALIHNNIALAYQENEEIEKAIAHYGRAIQLEPEYADAYFNMGTVFMREENPDQAFMYFKKSVHLNPGIVEAYASMAHILVKKGKFSEAIPLMKGLLKSYPNSAEIHNNLGNALSEVWNMDEAIFHLNAAVELNPDFAEAHNNLGNTLSKLGKHDEGMRHIERALQLDPEMHEALVSLGTIYKEKGHFREAGACYQKALLLNPDNADARLSQALIDLLRGRFREGWEGYEWRWKAKGAQDRKFPQPLWDGSHIQGQRLFVYAEQGVGDEIMFASCLPEMTEKAELCVIESDERLIPLFERSFPGATLIKRVDGDNYPPDIFRADYRIAMGSLPRFLRSGLTSLPAQKSYLVPDRVKVDEWKKRYSEFGEGLKIGISWRGGSRPDVMRVRSTSCEQWAGIFAVPDAHFINLQYGDCRDELKKAEKDLGVRIYDWEDADPLKDLDGFSAKVATLDLVISVDNATVHLAGALGVPVWVLLPFVPDWRWMLDYEDTPWYETVRLFRQKSLGEWGEVFEKVSERLAGIAAQSLFTREAFVFPVGRSYKER